MWPDLVSNPGPLTCESGALPTALRGPALSLVVPVMVSVCAVLFFHGMSWVRSWT